MANVKIKLSSDRKVNNVNKFSDIDVRSENLSTTLYDRNAIHNSLKNILTWKPYERILDPEFGNALWNGVFEMLGRSSKKEITSQVRKMLSAEPRIEIQTIDVQVSADNNSVDISFTYRIPKLDTETEEYSLTITKE